MLNLDSQFLERLFDARIPLLKAHDGLGHLALPVNDVGRGNATHLPVPGGQTRRTVP